MTAEISETTIRHAVDRLIGTVDLETTGMKAFTKMVAKELGKAVSAEDLKPHKAFLKQSVTDALSKLDDNQDDDDNVKEEDEEEDDDEEEEEDVKPEKKKGGGGLNARKEISPQLAQFLKQGKVMARTEIVKALWDYIKKHNLQNPENKREIFLDQAMQDVFGCERFTMFTMNKYVGAHIHPFKAVDLTSNSPASKRAAAATAAGKRKRKTKAAATSGTKKRKAGTQPPYRLSEELEAVVKTNILPRPQVVKKLWEYIKAHDLQNPENKKEILCDDTLKAVFKKSKVSMFKMNQLIGAHFLEKLDRSSYEHKNEAADEEEEESEEQEEAESDDE